MSLMSNKTGDRILTGVVIAKAVLFLTMLLLFCSCSEPLSDRRLGRSSLELTQHDATLFDAGHPVIVHRYDFGASAEYSSCSEPNPFCSDHHYVVGTFLVHPVQLRPYMVHEELLTREHGTLKIVYSQSGPTRFTLLARDGAPILASEWK